MFLNAGAIRRMGPNRLWTEAARRAAGSGVASIRVDLEAIGDADGDAAELHDVRELYRERYVEQATAAIDALRERAGVERVVLVGLCSGAFWAFHAAMQDDRVAAAVMLNPRLLFWDEFATEGRAARRVRAGLGSPRDWIRLLRGHFALRDLVGFARDALRTAVRALRARRSGPASEEPPTPDRAADAFDRLARRDVRMTFAFSGREPLAGELAELDVARRWPNVAVEPLPGEIHTLRPPSAQRAAHAVIDAVLAEELSRAELAPSRA